MDDLLVKPFSTSVQSVKFLMEMLIEKIRSVVMEIDES